MKNKKINELSLHAFVNNLEGGKSKKKVHSLWIFFFLMIPLTHCGNITQNAADPNTGAAIDGTSSIHIFSTDYTSSGQLYLANFDAGSVSLQNTGVVSLGSSAIIRSFNNLIYVLHDGFSTVSSDNVQIIDPNDNYNTVAQFSTGNGTNPKDIVVIGNTAYITLYNPSADPENIDSQNNPADLIAMDLTDGSVIRRWSLASYLSDDGDLFAAADQMVLIENKIYVVLQDLNSLSFAATSPGRLAILNINTNQVEGAIELTGRNPFSITASSDNENIYISHLASYNFSSGNFDTDEPYGGIEMIDVGTNQTVDFIDDETLGGYTERIREQDGRIFIVVSNFNSTSFTYSSQIKVLDRTHFDAEHVSTIDNSDSDIRDIFIDENYLWVSRRLMNTNTGITSPLITIMDVDTGDTLAPALTPAAPGMSLAGAH